MAKRKMDESETCVYEYLTHRRFVEIAFEPDGSKTPDFLVNGRIAIEVRRLNQHHETKLGEMQPLEGLAKSRREHVAALLQSLGPPVSGVSWYVSYSFKRPQLTKDWKKVAREKLQPFQLAAIQGAEGVIEIDQNFRLRLIRRCEPGPLAFILAGFSDFNSGGWLIHELEKNLTLCIEEKATKIAPIRARYPEWWLVLVDFVSNGTPEPAQVKHHWDKVLVVHPSNCAIAYEVKTVV
jgi:hypothetical protein